MGTRIAPPTVRRDGRSRLGAAATVAALAGLLVALAGCGTSTSPATDATAASSPDRTVEVKVGEVKVGLDLLNLPWLADLDLLRPFLLGVVLMLSLVMNGYVMKRSKS